MPLKKANCKSSVLSRAQRSADFSMWRGSSHLSLLIVGDLGNFQYAPALVVPNQHLIAIEAQLPGCSTNGCPAASDAVAIRSREAGERVAVHAVGADLGQQLRRRLPSGTAGSRVPSPTAWSGKTPLRCGDGNRPTTSRSARTPPGISRVRSLWLRSSMPMFG